MSMDAPTRALVHAALWIDRLHQHVHPNGGPVDSWREILAGCWTLLGHFRRGTRDYFVARRGDEANRLSAREREVITLAATGLSNKEIASALALTTGCVGAYLSAAMRKLGFTSRTNLVRFLARGMSRAS